MPWGALFQNGILHPRLASGLVGSFRHPWSHRSIAPAGRGDESQHKLSDTLQHQPSRSRARFGPRGRPPSRHSLHVTACHVCRRRAPVFSCLHPPLGTVASHISCLAGFAASRVLRQFAGSRFCALLTEPFPPWVRVHRAAAQQRFQHPENSQSLDPRATMVGHLVVDFVGSRLQ